MFFDLDRKNGDLSEANRSDLNSCGQPVQQLLTDYQDRPNGGDGWLPTKEEQGLAAMTLAQVLESNGKGARVAGLLTHSERVSEHHKALLEHGPRLVDSPNGGPPIAAM